jgi:succinyldiaminopimelate transaminase
VTVGPPRRLEPYPFAALDEAKQRAISTGIEVVDFGLGDPREPTPEFIRRALIESLEPVSSYPRAAGLPELREAISQWMQRRFGIDVDPERQIVPTSGAKEIIHSLAAYCLDDNKDTVLIPSLAYPVYERGARFHGAQVHTMSLRAGNAFLPDFNAIPENVLKRTALMWLNYPNNPTGFSAPHELYEQAADLARKYNFVLASDEAYSEIWFGQQPTSALATGADNVVVVNTLSKRSCMTGYRSGFIAGDERVIGRLRSYRPSVGTTPQDFVQRASVAAWQDEEHVEVARRRWQEKNEILNLALAHHDIAANNDATFFLWTRVPDGYSSASFAELLIRHGIIVTPGSGFGADGEGYVRFATVPTLDACRQAAELIKELNF